MWRSTWPGVARIRFLRLLRWKLEAGSWKLETGDWRLATGSPALRAHAVQLHVAAIDAVSFQLRAASIDLHVQLIEINVPDVAAGPAHEVVMVLRVDLELRGSTAALEHADQAGVDELADVAVDGCVRDCRQPLAHLAHELVGGGMTGRLAQRLQQDVALRRDAQASLDAARPELRLPRVRRLGHVSEE